MDDPQRILSRWLPDVPAAAAEPLAAGGFSGARLWRVRWQGEAFALRRWPAGGPAADRLAAIDALQLHLAECGLPAPRPVVRSDGAMSVFDDGSWWSLGQWLPGAADYWTNPREAKLRAALSMLARFHLAAAAFQPGGAARVVAPQPSPALQRRSTRLAELAGGGLTDLVRRVDRCPPGDETSLAREVLQLVHRVVPRLRVELAAHGRMPLPVQWRLGDIWHDHVLFTGDEVTGVVDFGAASIDSPAGDVARLMGSLAADDAAAWRVGLAAYAAVRPLSLAEQQAVRLFDSTGVVIAAVNWVDWLFLNSLPASVPVNRQLAFERLRRLATRLQCLANQLPAG
ncbi:MAG: hypothetical protein DCC67_20115 [Planctomycetota bacterium]|nr:MAG: hypothetical protein DCC67_20115 [Planctomycetota bacterium]